MAGSVIAIYITVRAMEESRLVLASPPAPVTEIVQKLGYDRTAEFVRHVGAEMARRQTDNWEVAEILLAVLLGGCLYLATERRIFPLILCGLMLAMVLFQHGAVSPEIAFRGREADFAPGNTNVAIVTRIWALRQVYFGLETVKLIAGGILASYLFVFHTSERRRRKKTSDVKDAVASH
jgi:hypothetical protein